MAGRTIARFIEVFFPRSGGLRGDEQLCARERTDECVDLAHVERGRAGSSVSFGLSQEISARRDFGVAKRCSHCGDHLRRGQSRPVAHALGGSGLVYENIYGTNRP